MKEVIYHEDGTTEMIEHPDPPKPPLNHKNQRRALVRARAAELDKRGKYLEASALRATLGE